MDGSADLPDAGTAESESGPGAGAEPVLRLQRLHRQMLAAAARAEALRSWATTMRLESADLRSLVRSQLAAAPSARLRAMRDQVSATHARADGLSRAVQSNRRIGMAIGILMTRRLLPEQAAWDCLVQESQRRNVKVRDLAEHVILTGDL